LYEKTLLKETVKPKKSKIPTISVDPQPRLSVRRSMVLGNVLDAERGRKKAFAQALGCTPSYVSQMISGRRPISEKAAKTAEKLFNLPRSELNAPIHGHDSAKIVKAVDEITTTINKLRQTKRKKSQT
jgi:DNA-binding transcriptional regulator YdaS (Cro superfamily)